MGETKATCTSSLQRGPAGGGNKVLGTTISRTLTTGGLPQGVPYLLFHFLELIVDYLAHLNNIEWVTVMVSWVLQCHALRVFG